MYQSIGGSEIHLSTFLFFIFLMYFVLELRGVAAQKNYHHYRHTDHITPYNNNHHHQLTLFILQRNIFYRERTRRRVAAQTQEKKEGKEKKEKKKRSNATDLQESCRAIVSLLGRTSNSLQFKHASLFFSLGRPRVHIVLEPEGR
jgi:hypothetical protein